MRSSGEPGLATATTAAGRQYPGSARIRACSAGRTRLTMPPFPGTAAAAAESAAADEAQTPRLQGVCETELAG